MKLIVGLGNPGRKYEGTRHNMGFVALDEFALMCRADFDKEGFKGNYAVVNNPSLPEKLILLKPETFMNLSGEAVEAISSFYKIGIEDIIVIYDDMSLAPGKIRLRKSGSSGSHNGMQNIIDHLHTDKIRRIRIGIGEPGLFSGADYVLSAPKDEEEKTALREGIGKAAKACRDILLHDFDFAMNLYNR